MSTYAAGQRPVLSPGVWEYGLDFECLGLSVANVEDAMGFGPEERPTPFADAIGAALERAPRMARIRTGYRVLPEPSLMMQREGFRLAGAPFHAGPEITRNLEGATGMAIFVATLGPRFDAWLQQCYANEDTLLAYSADALGAEAVERSALWIQARIAETAAHASQRTTAACCPGFFSWSILDQQKLFGLLPPRFCGVRLTESALMRPVKSVSGVIGIGPDIKERGKARRICPRMPRQGLDKTPGGGPAGI